MPWAAARAVMAPVVDKVQRLEAALAEARPPISEAARRPRRAARPAAVLPRQGQRASGMAEHAELEPLYRQAEACCGPRRATSSPHAPWSSVTWPRSTPRSRRRRHLEGSTDEVHTARLQRHASSMATATCAASRRPQVQRRRVRPQPLATMVRARSPRQHRHHPARPGAARLGTQRRAAAARRDGSTATTQTSAPRRRVDPRSPRCPSLDPRQALMDPPTVAEDKRFCSRVPEPGRTCPRGSPGRTKGFCPKCRTPFDFDPKLQPGTLLGGQYEIVGCTGARWHGLDLPRQRPQRERSLGGGEGPAERWRSRCVHAPRSAEKQYLAEVEHPLIVEIYNFVTAADGASYIVMEYVGGQSLNNLLKRPDEGPTGSVLAHPGRSGDRVHRRDAAGLLVPASARPAVLRLQAGQPHPGRRRHQADRPRWRPTNRRRPVADLRHGGLPGAGGGQPTARRSPATCYTVARTLAVLVFEFKGYQSRSTTTLPSPDDVPLFAEHDSLYRWLLKGTPPQPEDRFQIAEEMREQLLGVLREVTRSGSRRCGHPQHAVDGCSRRRRSRPTGSTGPTCRVVAVDPHDPMASWLATVTADEPCATGCEAARRPRPEQTVGGRDGQWLRSAGAGRVAAGVERSAHSILGADPWDWRGVWLQGLVALQRRRSRRCRRRRSTAVYGQLPGELAPKLALARACELGGRPRGRRRSMYARCARTDAAYVAAVTVRPGPPCRRQRAAATRRSRRSTTSPPPAARTASRAPPACAAAWRPASGSADPLDDLCRGCRRARPGDARSRRSAAALHIDILDVSARSTCATTAPSPSSTIAGVAGDRAVAARRARSRRTATAAQLGRQRRRSSPSRRSGQPASACARSRDRR